MWISRKAFGTYTKCYSLLWTFHINLTFSVCSIAYYFVTWVWFIVCQWIKDWLWVETFSMFRDYEFGVRFNKKLQLMKVHTNRKFLIEATFDLRLAWAGLVFKTFKVVLILSALFLEHANAIVVDLAFVFCVLQGRERIFSGRAIDVEDPFKIVG